MKFKHILAAAFILVVVMITGASLWYARPYLPMIGAELAILAMVLIGIGIVGSLYLAAMGALVLWHWQEGKRHDTTVIQVAEHGTYVRQGSTYIPLMPASVHVAALAPAPPPIQQITAPRTTVQELPTMPPSSIYPQAPAFATMSQLIRPGRLILGYSIDGPIYGDVTDLLSMAFVGKPGTGKSSALLYYLAMLLLVDATVHVFDPQGSLNEVADFLPYYGDFAEVSAALPAIYKEIAEREALWRSGRQVKGPMLILVDELPAIARWEQKTKPEYSLLELAEKVVLENRKHNVYCLLTGQSLPAEVLPTLTRDNLSSRLVFNSSNMHARMAGLDEESRKRLLPLLRKAQPGTAILDVSRRAEPDIAALPYTTVDDVRDIVERSSGNFEDAFNTLHEDIHEVPDLSAYRENTDRESRFRVVTGNLARDVKTDEKLDESIPEFSAEDERQIIQIARAQLATYHKVVRSRIPAAMTPPRNNSIYPAVKYILDKAGL